MLISPKPLLPCTQLKCHTAEHLQRSLEEAQGELRTSRDACAEREQRIKDLEREFETKKEDTVEAFVEVSSVCVLNCAWSV
jgi:chromosome segregation ATPase